MSFWDRARRALGAPRGTDEADRAGELRVPAIDPLERMGRGDEPFDDDHAVDAFERLARGPHAPFAIKRARALLAGAAAPRLRRAVARALDLRGDAAEAMDVLRPALEEGRDVDALMMVAELLERQGDREGARRCLSRALSLDAGRLGLRERINALAPPRSAMAALDATVSTAGATLGRYRLERQVGRGGVATVYAAVEAELERRVALKVYRRRGPLERARLLGEGRAAARIDHPGVVQVLDVDLRLFALALEWLPSESARARLVHGQLQGLEGLAYMESVVEALGAVHAAGLVHGDVKPSNLLARADGRAVVVDFGLARPVGAPPLRAGEGSLGYASPEQRSGADADPSADVYSLGVCLSELAAGAGVEAALGPAGAALAACVDPRPEARPSLAAVARALREARDTLAEGSPSE